MSISKLFLFKKDTDASSAMRGYQYQVFKTLETWLDNFLHGRDEAIYCDYEEDIFQHDEVTQAARFRQLKLYSTNFSFTSEEVKKALAHFFMLHVKTDHANKDKEFVFEANSRVADYRKGNYADLLQRWVADQDAMPDALLTQCAQQVKAVVSAYIQEQAQKLGEQLAERVQKSAGDPQQQMSIQAGQDALQEALDAYGQLTDADWETFTRSIKWRFDGLKPEEAFAGTIRRIEQQIAELPFDIPPARQEGLFGVLCKRVVIKASEPDPQGRKLVAEELRGLILQSGTEEEQWYQEVFDKWSQIGHPEQVRLGEFHEVLQAVRVCRWHPSLMAHDAFWSGLLDAYLAQLTEQPMLRQSTLYERLMLQLRPMEYLSPPVGDWLGYEDLVRAYFQQLSTGNLPEDIEDVQSLLMITWAVIGRQKAKLDEEEVFGWQRQLDELLEERFAQTQDPAMQCRLLESRFNRLFALHRHRQSEQGVAELMAPLEELFGQLNTTPLYNASRLSKRLRTLINLLIRVDETTYEHLIETLRDYVRKLDKEVVQAKTGAHQSARQMVEEGSTYLKSRNPKALLNALRSFHEAKEQWLQAETFEGYTLALLNIAQVYSAAGLHLAAKYYGLWAAWVSWKRGGRDLLKRIAQGYGMVFHADFTQGAWMSAMLDFEQYMMAWHEFDTQAIEDEEAEMPRKIITDYGFLLYAAPILNSALQPLADAKLQAAGYLKDEYLDELLTFLGQQLPEPLVREGLHRNFDDLPLNDLGPERTLRFYAVGIEWRIRFPNTYGMTALGEEFGALLQITLGEIALSKTDFHLPSGVIGITLEQSAAPQPPEQLPDNQQARWRIFVQEVETSDYEAVKMGTAMVTIAAKALLQDASLLPAAEFDDAFWGLFENNNLGTKSLQATSYQRMYRSFFSAEQFDEEQRQAHTPPTDLSGWPIPNPVLLRKSGTSPKYDQARALLNIGSRFRNALPAIHQTLARIKQEPEYPAWLQQLRGEGWTDWQVVMAMMNFMISYKANHVVNGRTFATEAAHQAAVKAEFNRLYRLDEAQMPVEFPLVAFQSDEFMFTLAQTPILVLPSFGLANNARFPNLPAVRAFMNERFNVQVDRNDEHNPLV